VAKEVTDLGRRAVTAPTDVRKDESATALLQATLDAFGRVDVLVNNAFSMPPMENLSDVDPDRIRRSIETTVFGGLRMTRTFAPELAKTEGAVVMINSAVIRHSRTTYGPYKLGKAALLAMAQSLATELGPSGVRVNSVAPGWIWGESLQWWFGALAEERGVDRKVVYDETAKDLDLRRLPEPDEIADAVAFLGSDLARAITGQCLDVNSGEFHH